MEKWCQTFRDAVAPLVSTAGLSALAIALDRDDSRLLQGATSQPPPLQYVRDWPVEAACALSYAGWKGDGLETVAEVEEYFGALCFAIDEKMGEPAACRYLLNWYDENERSVVFRELLHEVQLALSHRGCHETAKTKTTLEQDMGSPASY